jgi:hypothetical protein
MAQPALALLEPDDEPGACPAGLGWCVGECADPDGHYHGSDFASVTATNHNYGTVELSVSVHREDTTSEIGPVLISLFTGHHDFTVAPSVARQLAACLLNDADMADPLPPGVTVTGASALRLGDELLTGEGWQRIRGLMMFQDPEQVTAFTDEHDEDEGNGWDFCLDDLVRVRRPLAGSRVLPFVEPLP